MEYKEFEKDFFSQFFSPIKLFFFSTNLSKNLILADYLNDLRRNDTKDLKLFLASTKVLDNKNNITQDICL